MKKVVPILLILFLVYNIVSATHNRAGEITYRQISGYTFEFTIKTYTYKYSAANRNELPIIWGDGSSSTNAPLVERLEPQGSDYYYNTYTTRHTFPGTGVYEILMEDPNRNLGVKNIPNSVNTIFAIKSIMLIGSSVGANNTPVLLNPPIDKAAKGHIFIHNPAAFDPDGDSISYSITTCLGMAGEPIEGYVLPPSTDTLLINEVTGDLTWITPAEVGVYNVAILVEEWRKHVRIGRIERDMQIDVYQTDNHPPVNPDIKDYCVKAGDTISFSVRTTDADRDSIVQTMNGGPFEVTNPAVFKKDSAGRGYSTSTFKWITNCKHARQQPYYVVLKSEDRNDDIQLVDITSFSIKVLHPAPENLQTSPGFDTIRLSWDIPTCVRPSGYKIYRSLKPYGYIPDSCEFGVPGYTGFTLLDVVSNSNKNWYKDDNKGQGLVPGYDYCYMVTAIFNDGAESLASSENCATLIPGTPPILKVSVESDDEVTGSIQIAWAVPKGIDSIDSGPYRYEILRKAPLESEYKSIATIPSPDLKDTTYLDAGINTLIYPYTYSVVLYYEEAGTWHQWPGNEFASSQYIDILGADNAITLNIKKRTPWLNTQYRIFRRLGNSPDFSEIALTPESIFRDSMLINNVEYVYRSIGIGKRPLYNMDYHVLNTSHIAFGMPVDTIPPCSPDLVVTSDCADNGIVDSLTWSIPAACTENEIVAFKVYFKDSQSSNFELIDSLPPDNFMYIHRPDSSIEGYYAVTAIDSVRNESALKPVYVVNICGYYRLPNVFTPNNDKVNDIYLSFNLNQYVKKVDMTIYNRYGKVVFKTQDPNINWDGRSIENKKIVSTGVYYYICDVYEPRITGQVVRNLTGFIHVYSGKENEKSE